MHVLITVRDALVGVPTSKVAEDVNSIDAAITLVRCHAASLVDAWVVTADGEIVNLAFICEGN